MPEENVLFARETDTPPATDDVTAEAQASKYLICISDGLLYGVDAEQVEKYLYTGMLYGLEDPYAAYYTTENSGVCWTAAREATAESGPCSARISIPASLWW